MHHEKQPENNYKNNLAQDLLLMELFIENLALLFMPFASTMK